MNTERICIAGGPSAGKTTYAMQLSTDVIYHTDDLIENHSWSEASQIASEWFNEPGPWIVEGVAVPRALRKWLAANESKKPCDKIIWMNGSFVELSPGQSAMVKGCKTVWNEIVDDLHNRDVEIVEIGNSEK
jgi:hypothetical protein